MTSEKFFVTVLGKAQIEAELDHFLKEERPNIQQAIAEARALGDLRENAEYHAAKEKQSLIEGKIQELQYKMNNLVVVDPSKQTGTTIRFGATVTVHDSQKEQTLTYQIVGADEAAQSKGTKISYTSPMGQALIGREEGDVILVKVPKGDIELEIEKVRYI